MSSVQPQPGTGDPTRAALGRFVMRVGPWVAQLQRQVLSRLDPPLGFSQYSVLARLGRGTIPMSQLRSRSIVSFSTLSETTTGLVRLGLVDRVPSEYDRRSVDLSLTAQGREVLEHAEAAMRELEEALLEGVRTPTQDEVDELLVPLTERARAVLTEREELSGRPD
ncbi:MarR family transcriptional regulator [Lipingzhangella sp. LS1_29]|uniref:MarR family transcriptional regulator n=1 Tax=Lipingzhangella rawalii TaxID=2055835 RepID=A0ABU2H3I3_9ACTN|nr:MarR family transcriptional regulator [Lipingzhangella rawalii]MDS1269862.1 MarR family transcriptional regulator [Lipingzhangella rawalii]